MSELKELLKHTKKPIIKNDDSVCSANGQRCNLDCKFCMWKIKISSGSGWNYAKL